VGVAPRLARSTHEQPNVGAFSGALRLMFVVQGLFTAFVLGWAPLMVKVALGSRYAKSADVLRVLAPSIFLLGIGALVSVSANYLGEARRRVPIAVSTVIVNLVLDLILVPRIGVLGGAVGTDVAYALYVPAHLMLCQRILKIDLRPAARTLVRTFAAGGVTTAVLLLIGSPLGEAWRIPLGALAGCAAFAAVLWGTGEVDAREARSLLERAPFLRRSAG
jgi:O-antigen/teichoic acid export membrane protein